MSYKQPNTGDSVNDLFTNLANFMNIVPNMMNATEPTEFNLWFDKLYEIDKRSLKLYIEKHSNEIKSENYDYINLRYGRKIIG